MNDRPILIIDDERRMADSLAALLGGEGFRTRAVYGGQAGIDALGEEKYALVITDLAMSGVGGIDVIRHIAEHHPETLVIVMTGYASTDSAIDALHYRAFDYLRKPFDFDHMRSTVQRALSRVELDELRATTAAMITHDIKAPLMASLGYAAMLRDRATGELHERAGEYAEIIRANTQRVLTLIDNYLTTSRAEAGSLRINPRSASPANLVQDLLEVHEPEAARRGLKIEVDVSGAPERFTLDEPLVFRALGNLLGNAVKYADPAEPIRLAVAATEEGLRFELSNAAPGLLGENLEALFQRYSRAKAGAGIEGSGIGLYVVEVVARAHTGRAEASLDESGRVTFSLTIPNASGEGAV